MSFGVAPVSMGGGGSLGAESGVAGVMGGPPGVVSVGSAAPPPSLGNFSPPNVGSGARGVASPMAPRKEVSRK